VFDCLDHLTSNALLRLGGVGLALFGGWVMPRRALAQELRLGPSATRAVVVALRYVVPAGIVAASLASLAR
jgi:neurotransmitter:Na+ symporter, NSS family